MKKLALILLAGLLGCVVAFAVFYFAGTASSRALMRETQPELAWLKKEFHLSDAEFKRISALHQAYLPQCAERCRVIEQQTIRLKQLMDATTGVTPEIEKLMAERAQTRADCEAEMLRHFLEVSRTMPAEQGRRYLEWVEKQTILKGEAMEQQHHSETQHEHHAH